MTIRTVQSVLSANVGPSGTFTVGYPNNPGGGATNSGSYQGGTEHRLVTLPANDVYKSGIHFTLTFNTTNITVNLLSTFPTTLLAGTGFILQLEKRGANDMRPLITSQMQRAVSGYPSLVDLGAPIAPATASVAAVQAITGTAPITALLNGTLGSTAGVLPVALDVARNLQVVSSNAGDTTQTVTVTSQDEYGVSMQETLSLNGTTPVFGLKAHKTVKSITVSAALAGNLSVGHGSAIGLPFFLDSIGDIVQEYQNGNALFAYLSKIQVPFFINQTDLLAPTAQDIIAPVAGTITDMWTTVQAAITTGGTISVKIGTTATTGGVATIANAATKGTLNEATAFTALNVVTKDQRIQIVPASFATAGAVNGFIEITPSNAAALNGTVVAGSQSAPTATSGDVRGTYQPAATLDGVQNFQLVIVNPDPQYLGLPQFPIPSGVATPPAPIVETF